MDIDFDKLINLQNLDEEIKQTTLILEKIPLQLKDIDANIESQFQAVSQAKEKLAQNQKLRRSLEGDIQAVKAQIDKYKHQLGGVKTNKEYSALLKEIEEAQSKIDQKEEEIISEMLNADDIGEEIRKAELKANEAKEKLGKDKDALVLKRKELEEKNKELTQKKDDLIPQIPKEQSKLYLEIFKKKNGIPLSPVTDDFCSMCQIRIRPQVLNELRAENQIILCENCGRILYIKRKSS
ncbi:MAG: C4-type zinc ribbon domain-containing protein [Candidatus Aminicenantes bacterium]